jgi:serine/threonine-protein kinase
MMTVGTLVAGRYEIRDRLGKGAQGHVLEAFDRQLGRLVALKVLPLGGRSPAERADRRHRFLTEARAAARLQHPAIVTVYDSGEAGQDAWIAMELVIGQTLRDALRRPERPPLREALRIGRELLVALDAAHARGVIHRDVKPCNIMLEMDAGDGHGRVRLTDFGIASLVSGQKPGDVEFVGTPSVMAPEQIRGEPCDERTDLWSAGVVLYELLTGTPPFAGGVPLIYAAVLARDPLPPSLLNPELPLAFDAVMAQALAKSPHRRFQSAQAMAAAIDEAMAEPPPDSMPAAPDPVPAKDSGGRQRRGSTAMAFLAGVAAASAGFVWRDAGWRGWPGQTVATAALHPASAATAATTLAPDRSTQDANGIVTGTIPPVDGRRDAALTPPAVSEAPPEETTPVEAGRAVARPPPAMAAVATQPVAEPGPPPRREHAALTPALPIQPEAVPAANDPEPPGQQVIAAPSQPAEPPPAPAADPHGLATRSVEALADCIGDPPVFASGNHPGFGRIVLRWSQPVRYHATPRPGGLRLAFTAPFCISISPSARLPRNVRAVAGTPGVVEIDAAPGSTIRHFTLDRRTVIDVADVPRR